jgi:carbon-monoxide dehydrogenase medium subunit
MVLPTSVEECLRTLAERGPDARVVAGGTDLLVQLKNGMLRTGCVVDLSGVSELRQIARANGSGLRIGAAVTARTLERDPGVKAASGHRRERRAGRLGPGAEPGDSAGTSLQRRPRRTGAAALALDAEAVIADPRKSAAPFASFFLGVRTVLQPGELLVEIAVPDPGPHSGGNYRRHTPRRELDIAVVGVASQLTLSKGVCGKARIALAAVAPTPVRATAAERLLEGHPVTPELIDRAAGAAVEAAHPISDQRGSADFRRHLVQVLTRRTLTTALARASA